MNRDTILIDLNIYEQGRCGEYCELHVYKVLKAYPEEAVFSEFFDLNDGYDNKEYFTFMIKEGNGGVMDYRRV